MPKKFGYYIYFNKERQSSSLAYDCFLTSGTSKGAPKKILKWSCGESLDDIHLAMQCDIRFYLFNERAPYLALRKKRAQYAEYAKTIWECGKRRGELSPGSRQLVRFGVVVYDKKEDTITFTEA